MASGLVPFTSVDACYVRVSLSFLCYLMFGIVKITQRLDYCMVNTYCCCAYTKQGVIDVFILFFCSDIYFPNYWVMVSLKCYDI